MRGRAIGSGATSGSFDTETADSSARAQHVLAIAPDVFLDIGNLFGNVGLSLQQYVDEHQLLIALAMRAAR